MAVAPAPRPLDEAGLSANLRGNLVVRQTGRGEERDLLATGNRVHHVCGASANGFDEMRLISIDIGAQEEVPGRFANKHVPSIPQVVPMVEIPVWIISSGYVRSDGLIDEPARAETRTAQGPTSLSERARSEQDAKCI